MHDDPLGVGRETMRELGYRTVDLLVDWLADADAPPLRRATPEELQTLTSTRWAKEAFVTSLTGHPTSAGEAARLIRERVPAE